VPAERPQSKLQPLTINVTDPIRDALQKIADREILSLSDVARRAFRAEILRRGAEAERDAE
jgi:hypothetical protein